MVRGKIITMNVLRQEKLRFSKLIVRIDKKITPYGAKVINYFLDDYESYQKHLRRSLKHTTLKVYRKNL